MAKTKEESLKERLGSDLKFPIAENFEHISGLELLIQDIQQLLLTLPGERVFRPEFGCHLRDLIWENIADAEQSGINSIVLALERFEPRIEVLKVTSEANENTGLITFNIVFRVIETDVVSNLIFPFRTGTNLSFN